MYIHAHPSFPVPSLPGSTEADGNGISLTTPKGHLSHPLPKAHPITASLPVAEIGVGTTGFGIFFILFGVFLYFDSVLLAFGNVSAPDLWTTPNLPGISIAGASPKFLLIMAIQESGAIKPGPARWLGIDSRSCWTENLRTWILTPSSG